MRNNIYIFILSMMSYLTSAQTFIYNGLIEYECRTNNHKLMKEESPEWFESSKDRIPKYSIVFNNLIFDTCRTLYYPGKEPEQKPPFWGDEGIPDDYIFSDFAFDLFPVFVFYQKHKMETDSRDS